VIVSLSSVLARQAYISYNLLRFISTTYTLNKVLPTYYSGQIFALFILCKEAKKISNSLQKQTKKAKKILLIKIT
jgi:hypothetical protein